MNPPIGEYAPTTVVVRRTFMSQGAVNRLRHYAWTVLRTVDVTENVARAEARGSGILEHPTIR